MMKISIITVSYNSEKTIERTIQSVLSQKCREIEYIIIDGKSTDGTMSVVDKYRDRISHIVNEKDNGIYDAMNKGITLAGGEWVLFLNSDDYLCSESVVDNIVSVLNSIDGSVHIVYGKTWFQFPLIGKKKLGGCEVEKKDFYFGQAIAHCSCFFKTEMFKVLGMYSQEIKGAADYEWYLRFYSKYNKTNTCFVNEPITVFQDGGASFKYLWDNYQQRKKLSKIYFPFYVSLLYELRSPLYYGKYQMLWLLENTFALKLYKKIKFRCITMFKTVFNNGTNSK